MKKTALRSAERPRISHVARSSFLIAVFFGLDKALGLLRQVIIGRQFGVSQELDAFNAANNLPDLLFAIISGGALAMAFIPVLSEAFQQEGRKAMWQLFSRVANWAFLITGSFALIIALFADRLVRAELGIAPGFTPELQALVIELMRMNLIATLIFSLSGLTTAGLQSNQHFLLPALAPVMYDVGQIFGAVFLAPEGGYQIGHAILPTAGLGVHGLVYGVILGALLHLGTQIPGLLRFGFRWSPLLGVKQPNLRKVVRLMAPRILTIGTFQAIFVVQDNLASRLGAGMVTALVYGWLIMQVPETIIGTAIGTAILPTLSEHFARGDEVEFENRIKRALRVLLALTIPAAGLLIAGVRPLIQAVFQFSPRGTDLVVWSARAYLLGLTGHALLEIAARAFYARQNAKTPLLAAVISMGAFIVLSITLYRPLGAVGIGVSNSLAFTIEAVFLLVLLSRPFRSILKQGRALTRISAGTLLGVLATYLLSIKLPYPALLTGLVSIFSGGLLVLPFIWADLKSLRSL